jgi:hypothetical protein
MQNGNVGEVSERDENEKNERKVKLIKTKRPREREKAAPAAPLRIITPQLAFKFCPQSVRKCLTVACLCLELRH